MICSKTKFGAELDTIKQLSIDKGYLEGVIRSCNRELLASISPGK